MSPANPSGAHSGVRVERGALIECTSAEDPLELHFEFNPSAITRTRSVTVRTGGAQGARGGYDFSGCEETSRVAQGVTVNAESFTVKILLDATDRMNEGKAEADGVQPELDLLRSMVEPKFQGAEGARTLAALGEGGQRAISRQQYASVLLFRWGRQVLPVFLTQVQLEITAYLPTLVPYRAEATLTLQVIESNNPYYRDEVRRQLASAKEAPKGTRE
jgi:hypothetical protein